MAGSWLCVPRPKSRGSSPRRRRWSRTCLADSYAACGPWQPRVERVLLPAGVKAFDHAVELVEATADRPRVRADMPFANHVRAVAGRPEDFRDGDATVVEMPAVAGEVRPGIAGHLPDTSL